MWRRRSSVIGAVAEYLQPLGTTTPVQRPDAGQQLVELERLRQVVVGPGVETPDHVLDGVSGGEHEDRGVPALPPQLHGDLEAVLLRQDDVQQDDVVVVHVGQHGGLVAVGGDVHHVALLPQALLDESRDFAVVFHHEDFHGSESRGPILSPEADMKISSRLAGGGNLQAELAAVSRPSLPHGGRRRAAGRAGGRGAGPDRAPRCSRLPSVDIDVEDPFQLTRREPQALILAP